DSFPERLIEITDSTTASIRDNSVVWEGKLSAGGSQQLAYTLKANETFDRSFVASLSYLKGSLRETIYSSEESLEAVPPLEVIAEAGQASSYLLETVNLTINVTNRGRYTITPTIHVYFEDDVEITRYPLAFKKIDSRTYRWSEELKKQNLSARNLSSQFIFYFRGVNEDTTNIVVKTEYRERGYLRKLDDISSKLTIEDKGVVVRSNFGDNLLESNQMETLRVWVQNLNPYAPIEDVYVRINTTVDYVSDAFLERLEPMQQVKVVDQNFYAPVVSGAEGYIMKVNASYTKISGKNHSTLLTETLTVRPVADLIVSKTPETATIRGGEQTTITTTVKNPRLTELRKVAIDDEVPSVFSVRGPVSKEVTIRSGETVVAYIYTITAPRVNTETVFQINTTATYSEEQAYEVYRNPATHTETKACIVTVQPENFPLTVTKAAIGDDIYVGYPFQVKYILLNPSADKIAKDIVLTLPLQQQFDLLGSKRTYEIPVLYPGESVAITDEQIRPKYSGSLSAVPANITYTNGYGYPFSVLSTSASVTVESREASSPFIVLEKFVPEKVNSTEPFTVVLNASNIGSYDANVLLVDGERKWELSVKAGNNVTRNFTMQLLESGTVTLSQANATYSYGGDTFTTGSNIPVLAVLEKPLLRFEKKAPETANNIDNFTVELKITPLTDTVIENVVIKDHIFEWHFNELSSEKSFAYTLVKTQIGAIDLGPATASYEVLGKNFTMESNSPLVSVSERQLLTVTKTAEPSDILPGDEVTVTIKVKNNDDDEISAVLTDGERTWQLTLSPQSEESFSYKQRFEETQTLSQAVASYEYKGNSLESFSEKPVVAVYSDEKLIKEKEQSEGIISKIIGFIVKILTWRRSP
ncbi:hypothetical protein JXB11_03130, partial [Candidatus Woesearchaeota archaeon]|nr:hypothetical protein [Candidatus Woesearchaeota archaeon]